MNIHSTMLYETCLLYTIEKNIASEIAIIKYKGGSDLAINISNCPLQINSFLQRITKQWKI